jgi:hypothetical protein
MDVAEGQTLIRTQIHGRALEALKSPLLDRNRITARQDREEGECAEIVGGGGTGFASLLLVR